MATFQPPIVHDEYISEKDAQSIKKAQVKLYAYRNGVWKRAPKIEWYRQTPLRYHWGQHKSNDAYARKFPKWMEELASTLPEPVNHAIVIRYHDGMKTYAPWHADKAIETGRKTGCMQKGTGFYVISVGDPREFQLGDETAVLWSNALPHRSMIHISSEMNVATKHQVPQDPNWKGCRWSLIFRSIVE